MVSFWFQVQLVQTLLDALFGATGALWQQHMKVMDKVLHEERRKFKKTFDLIRLFDIPGFVMVLLGAESEV